MLKFSNNGKFLRQIGRAGQKVSNADTANVFKAADMHVNPKISELYVADGEDGGNRRVIVFDSNTGAYKRHWGAYGERPDDAPPPKYDPAAPPPRVFSTSVHCVAQGTDGLLYVCDRNNARIQVFRPDGSFVKEGIIKGTMIPVGGGPADIAFSTDQKLIYVAGANKIWILNRDSLQIVGSFSEPGEQPGQFRNLHTLATDQKGAIYTGELGYISELTGGRRVQKFVPIRP